MHRLKKFETKYTDWYIKDKLKFKKNKK